MKGLDWIIFRGPNLLGRHPAICCRLALPAEADPSLARRFLELATDLQRRTGATLPAGEIRNTDRPGIVDAIYCFSVAETGLHAGRLALRLIANTSTPSAADLRADRAVARFIADGRRAELDLTTNALVREAERRGIPWA